LLDTNRYCFRIDAKYRNMRLIKGVKRTEQKRKPQKPMRRSRPTIPATRHRARYPKMHGSSPMALNRDLSLLLRIDRLTYSFALFELRLEVLLDRLRVEIQESATGFKVLNEYVA
jgi:hypothetical protein